MARSILAQIARMITEMLILKMLQAAMPSLFGIAGGGAASSSKSVSSTPYWARMGKSGPRYGGIMNPPRKYSQGGIARGRDSGYGAVLHGTEAVVPLPNSRSIPVDLKGAVGGQNNVTVNVNMGGGQGGTQQTSSGDSQQAKKIGEMVAAAVQGELHHQKRAGGILNPYGVA